MHADRRAKRSSPGGERGCEARSGAWGIFCLFGAGVKSNRQGRAEFRRIRGRSVLRSRYTAVVSAACTTWGITCANFLPPSRSPPACPWPPRPRPPRPRPPPIRAAAPPPPIRSASWSAGSTSRSRPSPSPTACASSSMRTARRRWSRSASGTMSAPRTSRPAAPASRTCSSTSCSTAPKTRPAIISPPCARSARPTSTAPPGSTAPIISRPCRATRSIARSISRATGWAICSARSPRRI